ncbi:hypothetical protein EPUS_02162 [Endocarpon pusillum Z07020]|uniref:TAFII55 protein conserved region domain-containing protein n=1 Tax=Endocarpon pusillum (strain Z07020 / HMAS-L-300199) TaxID=1263415 RepID=U1HPF9_ENDPU|nr:uncharacterized protein EPUS_02162 [Endocarpon pusillum Z07020]ERF72275.1 hypothetical protein EPUS_02162 [Endocarpon pusillum Z07020]
MSADSSQGAFRGLRSRNPRSSTSSPSTLTWEPSRERIPGIPNNSGDIPSTYSHPLSQDYSPRPQRNSNLRYVLLTDALETPEHSSTSTPSPSSFISSDEESDDLDVNETPTRTAIMSSVERPKLKLNFSKNRVPSQESVTSPAPQTILRTPSLKLRVKPEVTSETTNPTTSTAAAPPPKKKKQRKPGTNDATPGSSAKKRKQPDEDGSDDELSRKPAQVRKITLTTKSLAAQSPITPTLKIKHKGRIPKRPLGLGYDSELDEREADPTILEAFILRMPPGPDADYLRDAVQHGTIGVARSQGGADVQMKFLDRSGRRGLVIIRGQRWAATLVDLPCIVEGMKSWDKKGWVKSADICQMLLVLGKVQNDDQAKDYPLPEDVNQDTWQYAHGLTPPMKHVRARRFKNTKRTSVNAIEAVERKVNQLLADDDNAVHTKFELLDHDPETRSLAESDTEGGEGYDEGGDEDAYGEEIDGDFFDEQNGAHADVMVETPTIIEPQPLQEEDNDDFIFKELEAQEQAGAEDPLRPAITGLSAPGVDVSNAITSTSPSVADTAAETPAAAETSEADEEESEDFDAEEDESMDEEDREAAAQKQKARDEIQELKEERKKQIDELKGQRNEILRAKLIRRIEQINGDMETARKAAGLEEDAEDSAEEE